MLAKLQLASSALQRTRIDQTGTAFGKLAFRPIRKIVEQILAGKKVEHCIAEKFEPLVVADFGRAGLRLIVHGAQFWNSGAVRQSLFEQGSIFESYPEFRFQPLIVTALHGYCRARGP